MALPTKFPKDFDHDKNLLKIVMQVHNRKVAAEFKDVVIDKGGNKTTKGRRAIYTACLIRREDSWSNVLVRFSLFYSVLGYGKGGDAIATMPEFWAMKNPRNRSQLCIIYKIKGRSKYNTTTYQVTIPNYNSRLNPEKIPTYRKGNHSAKILLKDGSYLIVNGEDKAEAKRVLDLMIPYIRKPMLVDSKILYGERKDDLNNVEVYPVRADFYPRGKTKDAIPKWSYDFALKKRRDR